MKPFLFPYLVCFLCFVCGFDLNIPRLGVDYGPQLIGLSVQNKISQIRPLKTISNTGDLTSVANEVIDHALHHSVEEIIVGIPLDYKGVLQYDKVHSFNGNLCLNFSRVLSTIVSERNDANNLKTILFDERYTTQEAKLRMKQIKDAATLDAMSAVCLVERYIEDRGDGSIPAIPYKYPMASELTWLDMNLVRENSQSRNWKDKTASYMELQRNRMEIAKFGTFKSPKKLRRLSEAYDSYQRSMRSVDSLPMDKDPDEVTYTDLEVSNEENDIELLENLDEIELFAENSKSEDEEPLPARPLTAMEIAEQEYLLVKAQRRKRGTLKKYRVKQPVIQLETANE